jgi:ubiquinone/menaquinone biosynthesis C-methylase UbiE
MPTEPPPREDTYIIDPESGTEMVRLTKQHRIVTRNMGGLFPQEVGLSAVQRVLDLACGPGGWVLDVAFAYPKIEIVGVDISQAMTSYARAQMQVQGLHNAAFKTMNILKPLEFDDDSLDFVNARMLAGVLSAKDWPGLIQECKRILRPGGILRLTEADDMGITNSAALEQLVITGANAARKAGRSFFPEGRYSGTMAMLGRFLRSAGFQDIHQQAYMIDWSADASSEAYTASYENIMIALHLLRSFMAGVGVISPERYDELAQQAIIDMQSPDFCAIGLFMSAWGKVDK